ncbi:hypothetical protein CRG98_001052 [Punica granatum]|uniref:G-patch domain-containing protein n=1 Tax=Punica granatum TaxID=22663 RepID=A0A2I0LCY7_PUNGR|nr:hypothetical protein CRG98_001052 [Punica granatum]
MRVELRTIREERDRLRCELVDSRTKVADYRELQTELARARAQVVHLDREMARLSARLDRVQCLRMAEGDRVDISEEVNPPVSAHSQPPPMHAPPLPTPAGVLPAYSGALPTHLPPPTSSGAPLPPASLTSSASDDQARIAALEGTLLALLRGPNRASSSSTPPPGQGPTADPTPWVPPTQASENMEVPAPPTLHTSMAHPFTSPFPPTPTAVPLPPTSFLTSDQVLSTSPPVSMPVPAAIYAAQPPTIFPASSAPAPTHPQAAELSSYLPLQPHTSFPYQAPPPINTAFHEPGTPTHAAQFASPTHFFAEADTEQERRLKRMEETIRALQASDSRPDARYETPPTLLELSLKEMAQGQRFEEYATKWRAQAAKHIPPISEAQQIQLFHSTLRGKEREGSLGECRQYGTSGVPAVFSEFHVRTSCGALLRPACTSIPASTPYPTDLLFRTTASTPTYGAVARHPPLYPYSIPSTPIPTPGSEDFSANATSPTPTRSPNVQANPLPDHGPARGPSINMITICTSGEGESEQGCPSPFVIEYVPAEAAVGFTGIDTPPAPFIIDIPARESYSDDKVPWTYEGSVGNLEQQFGVMGITHSGWLYESPAITDKGKAPAAGVEVTSEAPPIPPKKVTEEEAEAFMKIIKETVSSIFSSTISFSDDELPSEGCTHSRALHIVCKCNNHIVGRVMINNGSALNVCPVITLKQMNVDLNRVRPSKTAVRAFDGSRREVNGEIDLLIEVGPCSFSVTFQVLNIPNTFSLLLGRPWIHSAGAVPSSLHQKLKFIVEERLITVKGEEDYAIYKETAVPYISVGNDENLPFHSFETISVIRDYGEIEPSRADPMIGKVLLHHNYVPGTGLGARGQGISRPIKVEEYKHGRGLGFRSSCHEIIEARRGNHLHRLATHYGRLNRGMQIPLLSYFFPRPSLTIGSTLDGPSSDLDDTPDTLPTVYAVTEEIPSGVHIRLAQENEELNNWTPVPRYSAVIADVLHSNPNHRHVDSNPSEECLGEPRPIYFGEGLDEDSQVPEIEEGLHRLEGRQLTSVEPTEEINVGTEDKPRTIKIGSGLDPTQRALMIDFLTRYQEVFAWSYADMPGLDPSIVKHFLPLDTEKFPPKQQQLRRQRASLLLRIKEEVVKQINAGFLEVCNYSEWVANIVPVEKKDERVRVCVDYRDVNKASPKDNFPLPHIDILVDNTARHAQFSFMDGFSGYNQIRLAEEDKIKTTFTTMWGTFCYRVMPFGLKNARATYQRAMVTLFHDMMHKEVEYKLRLNPAKCTFGARSGKLLGFVVSERGIEVDPDKVTAIRELPPPSSARETNANHSFACSARTRRSNGMKNVRRPSTPSRHIWFNRRYWFRLHQVAPSYFT